MLRILILTVALIAGGAAAWLAVSMRPQTTTVMQPAPPPPMQEVLVATTDVGVGQTLTKENMRWQSWPEGMVNPTYVTRSSQPDALDNLTGTALRTRIASGEPVLKEKLVQGNSGFLSAMLPRGKRAVAIAISAESTAGGFILPNDRVDVIHTIDQQGESEQVTRTILRNVLVLAIDQSVDEPAKNDKNDKSKPKAAAIGKTATLELNSDQAEVIAGAEAKGRLSLVLRSNADNDEIPSVGSQPNRAIRIIRAGQAEILKVQ